MISTIAGQSGRVYVQCEALQRHHEDYRLSVFKAEPGSESFVFERVPRSFYHLVLCLAAGFAGSRRLRMHMDCNQKEDLLVYPYFKGTLLAFLWEDPDLPLLERKKTLRRVGEAIQELHGKDWIHIDVKPDNMLVNWTCDKEGNKTVTLEDGKSRQTPHAVENAMWRSPEGQTGRSVTKASDIFSFILVCIYALGGGGFLLLDDHHELANRGIAPEQEILVRHFSYFGPAPEGLFKPVNSEDWCSALKAASEIADEAVKEQPELRFKRRGEELDPEAQNMISGMTNLDPLARTTIYQVLMHQWWQEDT
ncbi:kinase-like protein [Pleomassaria siparia CBS 279.74]|uniref:Kinase-like protein n=1 Tax=Pleomassaria siparia CBS 279.74 TaxID=1314801 RepID=A0A6G1JR45_9PLEO|nr:kinase-like protein [Pleomassaria siparia CBS 279.74]